MKRFAWTVLLWPAIAAAQTVAWNEARLSWTHPTTNTDGSAIPTTGPAALASTVLRWAPANASGACPDSVFTTPAGTQTVAHPATTFTVTGLAVGTHCFQAASRNNAGVQSAWSAAVTKTVVPPTPNPPTLTIAVVQGINRAPVFLVSATGARTGTVAGFAPVGAECAGDPLFTYRGAAYRRLADWSTVQWWGTSPTTRAAAPCA